MKEKFICLFIALSLILSSLPIYAQNGEVCGADEKCDGAIVNGVCTGECVPKDEETCSLFSFSIECIVGDLIGRVKAKVENFFNEVFLFILDFKFIPKGNEKLWQFSYGISFLIATFLLIVTTISYFKEALSANSSVELLDSYKSQFFKFIFMFLFLAGSAYITALVLEGFDVLNLEILNALNFNIGQALIALIFSSLIILLPIIYFTLGLALAAYIGVFVVFFLIAALRILILTLLLSIIPIAIVFYFFDFTKKIGALILRLTFSHLIILTIWLVIFGAVNDLMSGPSAAVSGAAIMKGFFLTAAFVINTMLYFKINAFFAALSFGPQKTQRIVERITTRERMTVVKEKMFGKSLAKGQKTLTVFRR